MLKGSGNEKGVVSEQAARKIILETLNELDTGDKKILVIIPDNTRSGPTGFMFRQFCDILGDSVNKLDFLIALGTHPVMPEDRICEYLGLTSDERNNKYGRFNIFNHRWDLPETFADIGKLSSEDISRITGGMFERGVTVRINKMVLDYDMLIIYGPVFPHEVVGFSGGNKYLFPGIAGPEIINFFHWLGAVITNMGINGRKNTPPRQVVEQAAALLKVPSACFCSVVSGNDLKGLYAGDTKEAWSAAADLSAKVNVKYADRRYNKVLGIAPAMYDDLWTAGKVMYKLESVVADGGDLIIYAPHITEVSYTHGKVLDDIGYHVKEYFEKQMDRFKNIPGGVMAHSTHVKGVGAFDNGVERPRVNVILATGIPEERCRKINLGYMAPEKIDISEWEGREEAGILVVHHAGEVLYKKK